MCGIAGLVDGRLGAEDRGAIVDLMAHALRHRGPDDLGRWVPATKPVAFSHTRLAIIDLSSAGHQPMQSRSGRWTITYNGELYNYLVLRDELVNAGIAFRGSSDTEVVVNAIERWGFDGAISRFNGMFALGAWDDDTDALYLARDRVGEKPLYYAVDRGRLFFASEQKAMIDAGVVTPKVDSDALALYLRFGYVPSPRAILHGVRKLAPGERLRFRPGGHVETASYWEPGAAGLGNGQPSGGTSISRAADQLEALLFDAVGMRMMSDVSLGAFLSGGVDSSTVVALMQQQSAVPVRTFTVGYGESEFDEARHASAVAKHLRVDHTELRVTPSDAEAVIPSLPRIFDEPFADSSAIPTFLVAQLARQHVTVALSGDGGDELFGGYERYRRGRALAAASRMPTPLRGLAGRSIVAADRFAPRGYRGRVARAGHALQQPSELAYTHLIAMWSPPSAVLTTATEPPNVLNDATLWPAAPTFSERMMRVDIATYLPDDILTKVDRTSMAVSLEARVPLLDPRVIDFARHLPLQFKMRRLETKRVLKEVLYRHVPRALVDRPKMGFGVPVAAWLRGPLRMWADRLLASERLEAGGHLQPSVVRPMWQAHLDGRADHSFRLWTLLMFEAWREEWRV
jgi:asparagine synthase (glutamine-hydrolysing)